MMKANDKLIVRNEEAAEQDKEIPVKKKKREKSIFSFMTLGHLTLAPDNSTILETAWVDNKLIFDNETFEEVAVKMERWYGVIIRFKNDKLRSLRMTGTFEKESITEALAALQLLSPFSYTMKNDYITIVN
jgi:transmembrane sensor